MKKYFIKTPFWLRKFYSKRLWRVSTNEKKIYLSFDDGPHPEATPFVLNELRKHHTKATFFCIGKNVTAHPAIFQQIIKEGHAVGNHTQNHLNGWHTATTDYIEDVNAASQVIASRLFRPPYGRMTAAQVKEILKTNNGIDTIVMWDVLSGDFDNSISHNQCLNNVIKHAGSGSIIVFHDSEKALDKLKLVLPQTIEYFISNGYVLEALV